MFPQREVIEDNRRRHARLRRGIPRGIRREFEVHKIREVERKGAIGSAQVDRVLQFQGRQPEALKGKMVYRSDVNSTLNPRSVVSGVSVTLQAVHEEDNVRIVVVAEHTPLEAEDIKDESLAFRSESDQARRHGEQSVGQRRNGA